MHGLHLDGANLLLSLGVSANHRLSPVKSEGGFLPRLVFSFPAAFSISGMVLNSELLLIGVVPYTLRSSSPTLETENR